MHGIRDKVFPSRQYFPDRAHLCGYMLDAVDDLSVCSAKNDIAVFSHDFHDQFLAADIPKLVQVFNVKVNDALQRWLKDVYDPSISDVFAKQHAEVRRCHWAWFVF